MKIRRILVAVDASPHSLAAMEAAVTIAEMQKDAELAGLFVEDTNLLRLAQLPFAREVIYPHRLGQPIDVLTMRTTLKELAERARETLSDAALRAGVRWSFNVRRGSVAQEILSAAQDTDLLVIGKTSQEGVHRVRLGGIAANLLTHASQSVLAIQHGESCQGPVLLVTDGSPASLTCLPAAERFARLFGGDPVILLLANDREEAANMKRKIQRKTGLKGFRFRRSSPCEAGGLARISHDEEAGMIILTALPSGASPETLPDLLARIDCPILLYRNG